MDGRMEGQTDSRMDRQTDRQAEKHYASGNGTRRHSGKFETHEIVSKETDQARESSVAPSRVYSPLRTLDGLLSTYGTKCKSEDLMEINYSHINFMTVDASYSC